MSPKVYVIAGPNGEEHIREGLPIYIWRNGKVVAVPPEELKEHSR
jgi:hypothetical protein